MAARLTEFIRAGMRREFVWGQHDCSLFCANLVLEVTGVDPARRWRGRYNSEAGMLTFVNEAGLVALFDQGTAGILERCVAEDSIIGVITTDSGDVGAVRSGRSWVVLTERGIGRVRADLVVCLAAWGLPCPRL